MAREPDFILTSTVEEFDALLRTRNEAQLRASLSLHRLWLAIRHTPEMARDVGMIETELRRRGLEP